MLDPAKRAELEQSTAMLVEMIPPVCWQLYQGFVKEGFSEAQAFALVCNYLRGFVAGAK